ncbi:hypothetical protein [Burkholderia cepacia]|uniref:Uncharacterized protein n=1 Tax=Burkholderia cepacia GG4 TaxID=1009846 RepID=A0A9W3K5T6_BURCE|nr:hypothetical protein [Burkholderia cepacia]AFQ50914.1 hypothetical protein GEM_4524 [Burkholderia cepacia GG4]
MVKALITPPSAAGYPGRATPADACPSQHRPPHADTVFGLWKVRALNGLAYQEALRAEW